MWVYFIDNMFIKGGNSSVSVLICFSVPWWMLILALQSCQVLNKQVSSVAVLIFDELLLLTVYKAWKGYCVDETCLYIYCFYISISGWYSILHM